MIVTLLIAVAPLPIGVQAVLVLLQTMIVSIDPAARSRLNTARIVCNFICGAIGSTLAAVLWEVGQWPAVMGGSAVVVAYALALRFIHRKRAYRTTRSRCPRRLPRKISATGHEFAGAFEETGNDDG